VKLLGNANNGIGLALNFLPPEAKPHTCLRQVLTYLSKGHSSPLSLWWPVVF